MQLLGVLKKRFPDAFEYVEAAARAGSGALVRSRLGRTCPPPSVGWRELTAPTTATRPTPRPRRRCAAVAASPQLRRPGPAADWALALLGSLRRRLTALGSPRLVFFQHDEVIVHTPAALAGDVTAAVHAAADEARRLLFGDTPVVFPMEVAVVDRYADAK